MGKGLNIAIGIFIVLLLIGVGVGLFFFTPLFGQSGVGGVSGEIENVSEIELDFCSSEEECKRELIRDQGMPPNFLEENNLIIKCSGSKCVLTS